ncbi:MAG: hypothetical protein WC205_09100 [Opitutaceae bacterium]|jgi:hypothetical protein
MKKTALFRLCLGLTSLCALYVTTAKADMRTLTDQQGRSLKADVLSVENGKVKIKRDDGQTFELPLATLSEADQQSLKQWAEKAAAEIPSGAVIIELSRGVFDSTKKEDIGSITTEENWGYSLTASNRTNKPIKNLKIEYALFVKPDLEPGKDSTSSKLKRSTGTTTIPEIAAGSKIVVRTDSVKIYKQKLKPGWVWGKTGGEEKLRDTLYGIWMKAYVGDQIVVETVSPDGLSRTEKGP